MRTILQSFVRPAYGKTRRWILSQLQVRAPWEQPTTAEQIREVSIEGIPYPIKIRVGTSDARAMSDCLLDMQYDVDLGFEPKTVIDLGGNIGCSAIYFANRWPNAKIVVVEPVPANFEILKQNTSYYPNIIPVHAAVHPRRETVQLVVPKKGFWAAEVVKPGSKGTRESNSAQGIPLDELLNEHAISQVDLLKIDIEGSEAELFANNPHPWLSRTRLIMIELHDNIRMGCTWHMERALKPYKTRKGQISENLLVWLDHNHS
jgi:FkbM family methyltransferase